MNENPAEDASFGLNCCFSCAQYPWVVSSRLLIHSYQEPISIGASNSHVLVSRRFHEPTYFLFIVSANSNQSHASILNHWRHQKFVLTSKRNQNGGLSDSSCNLSVVSDEDFEVSRCSEDSVREDELEIEHGSAVSRPVCSIILPRTRTSLEISRE